MAENFKGRWSFEEGNFEGSFYYQMSTVLLLIIVLFKKNSLKEKYRQKFVPGFLPHPVVTLICILSPLHIMRLSQVSRLLQ